MSIIGINGKIGSGKDLTGKIIQVLTSQPTALDGIDNLTEEIIESKIWDVPNFEVKKFAGKLKDMVCLLIGCTREDLEDNDFKNTELGKEWEQPFYYGCDQRDDGMDSDCQFCDCKPKLITPRKILQLLGTEGVREIIHPNAWVNALMSEYIQDTGWFYTVKPTSEIRGDRSNSENIEIEVTSEPTPYNNGYPNWVITDMRFPNEFDAIKNRSGITVRVERKQYISPIKRRRKAVKLKSGNYIVPKDAHIPKEHWNKVIKTEDFEWNEEVNEKLHPSETALDKHNFDYTIHNNGSINDLVESVKTVLRKIDR